MQQILSSPFINFSTANFTHQVTTYEQDKFLWPIYEQQFQISSQLMINQLSLSEELQRNARQVELSQNSSENKINNNNSDGNEHLFVSDDEPEQVKEVGEAVKGNVCLRRKLRKKKKFRYQIDDSNPIIKSKKCQTKNTIKNYMKALFTFIRKSGRLCRRVLTQFNVPEDEFLQQFNLLSGNINNIMQLRDFWVNNRFCKVFRIFSDYFMRRYYLSHIFHSRVLNRQIHLKYRKKFLNSLKNPSQFTYLKQY